MAALFNACERIQVQGSHRDIAGMAARAIRREDGRHILGERRSLVRSRQHGKTEQDARRDGNYTSHSRILQATHLAYTRLKIAKHRGHFGQTDGLQSPLIG